MRRICILLPVETTEGLAVELVTKKVPVMEDGVFDVALAKADDKEFEIVSEEPVTLADVESVPRLSCVASLLDNVEADTESRRGRTGYRFAETSEQLIAARAITKGKYCH